MARGFEDRGHLLGAQNPQTEDLIITNSATVTIGDAVKMLVGFVSPVDANDRIYGVVTGIVDANGIDLRNANSSNFDGTFTEDDGTTKDTYVAYGDNQTDKKVQVRVVADPYQLWFNDTDDTLTTAMLKQHFSLIDEDQVDGDTNSATVGEMQLWKLDPDNDADASKGIFRITAWQGDAFEPET